LAQTLSLRKKPARHAAALPGGGRSLSKTAAQTVTHGAEEPFSWFVGPKRAMAGCEKNRDWLARSTTTCAINNRFRGAWLSQHLFWPASFLAVRARNAVTVPIPAATPLCLDRRLKMQTSQLPSCARKHAGVYVWGALGERPPIPKSKQSSRRIARLGYGSGRRVVVPSLADRRRYGPTSSRG
jgi:hypothetical protein